MAAQKSPFSTNAAFSTTKACLCNINKALIMELSLLVIVVLCLFFFVAGFVDSVAGGGGLISTPAMLLCGLPPHTALGTGKFASTLGSLTSLWTFARNHLVVLRIAPAGFVSAFVGGMAGSGLAMHVDSAMLGKLLIFLLPVGMVISLFSGKLVSEEGELPEKHLWLLVILMGFFIGAYDGFFGPGTGSFFIIAQHLVLRMGLVAPRPPQKCSISPPTPEPSPCSLPAAWPCILWAFPAPWPTSSAISSARIWPSASAPAW